MSYTLQQEEYRRLKTRLTYRINRFNKAHQATLKPPFETREAKDKVVFEAKQLIREVDYANGIFDEQGYPDAWNRWARAKEDAEYQILRNQ